MTELTYEQKMLLLQNCKPENKDIYLLKLLKGETIDLTKDEDLFYQVNKDRVTLEQFVNRDKFKGHAQQMKWMRQSLKDTRHAKSGSGKGRLLGEIPAEIYFGRKEFSSPSIDRQERLKNIKHFFNQFPAFRAGEGHV